MKMKEISAKDHMDLLMSADNQEIQDTEENPHIPIYTKAMVGDALEITVTHVDRLVREGQLTPVYIRFASGRARTFILLDRFFRAEYQYRKDIKSNEDMDYTEVKRELIRLAGEEDVILYSVLLDLVGYPFVTYYKKKLNDLLLRISKESYQNEGFLLSALVITKTTERPVPSFYKLAVSLGLMEEWVNGDEEKEFFEQQKTIIFERLSYIKSL